MGTILLENYVRPMIQGLNESANRLIHTPPMPLG